MKKKKPKSVENHAVHGPLFCADCCWDSAFIFDKSFSNNSNCLFSCLLILRLGRRHVGSSIHNSSHRLAIDERILRKY